MTEFRDEGDFAAAPGLHVVATPIGRLKDISLHAIELLKNVSAIYAEDTRVTQKLISHFGIKNTLFSYHEHNGEKIRPKIIEQIRAGNSIALVCDAGTPLISDPGYKLVKDIRTLDLPVHVAPGPCAVTAALSIAGLPTDKFLFLGFLPSKSGLREKILKQVEHLPFTLVFYETGHRLLDMLAQCYAVFGERPCAIARELTKIFEEVRLMTLSEQITRIGDSGKPKGELVVMIEGARLVQETARADIMSKIALQQLAEPMIRPKQLAKKIAVESSMSASEIYDLILTTKPDHE